MGGKNKKRKNIFHVVLIACIFMMGAFYLFEVNSMAKERFELRGVEKNLAEIQDKNKTLEMGLSEATALRNLESMSRMLDLEEVRKVSYVEVRDTSPLVLSDTRQVTRDK